MKIYFASSNFLGRNEQKNIKLLGRKAGYYFHFILFLKRHGRLKRFLHTWLRENGNEDIFGWEYGYN